MSAAQHQAFEEQSQDGREKLAHTLSVIRRDRGKYVHELAVEALSFLEQRGPMRRTDVVVEIIEEREVIPACQPLVDQALSALTAHELAEWRGHGYLELSSWVRDLLDPTRECW